MPGPKKSRPSTHPNPKVEAISYGIYNLTKSNPIFKGYEQTLLKHIDNQKVNDGLNSLIKEKGYDPKNMTSEQQNIIFKELSDYVTSGKVFDEKGWEIVLGKEVEEKGSSGLLRKIGGFFKGKSDNKGIEYLNRAIDATEDLKDIFSKNEYYKKMPEIAKAVSSLDDLKALYPAARVLKAHGWIDNEQYKNLTNKVYKIAEESSKTISKGIENQLDKSYQKLAASILGIFGALLILSNVKITGGVIGTAGTAPNIAGIILIIASLGLFLFKKKKL